VNTDICRLTALELATQIRARQLSAVDVLSAHLQQIERVNPLVHAIITLVPELAMKAA